MTILISVLDDGVDLKPTYYAVLTLSEPRTLTARQQVMEFVCQYDVREILGQGSFYEVKRCIDKRTRQTFAVKEMSYDTEEKREKIEQEVEVSLILALIYSENLQFATPLVLQKSQVSRLTWFGGEVLYCSSLQT